MPQPENSVAPVGMKAFADYATEASDGKLGFEFFHSGTLIPVAELLPGLSSGVADIGMTITPYAPDSLPNAAWTDRWAPSQIDWGFPKASISSVMKTRFSIENDVVRSDMESENTVPLWSVDFGPYVMLCTEPAETPADLAGRSVRVGGEPHTTEVTNLGMTPSFIPGTDTYEALQRGVIDCSYQDASAAATQGLMGVAKNLILTDGSASSGAALSINKDTWDSLPAEAQEILRDATVAALTAYAQETLRLYAAMIELAQEEGVTITSSAELDELLRNNRAAQGEAAIADSPASVADPSAVVADFQAIAGEWEQLWDQNIGLERVDSADTAGVIDSLSMGPDGVDWSSYEQAVAALLEPVRQN
ncbi:TRAP transporter substrate-binding protein DctP [Dietzia sp. CH92]|uniref:TRAP transporter substrate-binding protein DctP n=1 Tax=Dietzia sp. CH92 TaxID=3051823 RepID=UPI0028D04DF8|nr:TRAP transporter substrate-binding protein DctP [Dietzia sp. CH92]